MTPALTAEGVCLAYGETHALRGVDLVVEPGEVVAIVGSSGSGKTSLLYCLSGLQRPSKGVIHINGQPLPSARSTEMARLRRSYLGFVFQFAELVPELTLEQNIALPLRLIGTAKQERVERVRAALGQFGIEEAAGRRPDQVSGGQAQRAAIARAVVHRPSIIFADEPTGSLDSKNAEVALSMFTTAARSVGTSVVIVTHDGGVARRADRTVSLRDGLRVSSA